MKAEAVFGIFILSSLWTALVLPTTAANTSLCGSSISTTFRLTSDVGPCKNGLTIAGDNLTLNCQGHTISGNLSAGSTGIAVDRHTGVTIENCRLSGFHDDIALNSSSGITLTRDRITGSLPGNAAWTGILMYNSTSCTVYRNLDNLTDANFFDVNGHLTGIYVLNGHGNMISTNRIDSTYGINLTGTDHNTVINNVFNMTSFTISSAITLNSSDTNLITQNRIFAYYSVAAFGILLGGSSGNFITKNKIVDTFFGGIEIDGGANNTLSANIITAPFLTNYVDITLSQTTDNTISGNTILDGGTYGVQVLNSSFNLFEKNYEAAGYIGYYLDYGSNGNNFTHNTATRNFWDGFDVYDSSRNSFSANTATHSDDGFFFFGHCIHQQGNSTGCLRTEFNTIKNNVATNNNYDGFDFWNANNNTVQNNFASGNARYGFELSFQTNFTLVESNAAFHNMFSGYQVNSSSNFNVLQDDLAKTNRLNGFYLYMSAHNSLVNDTAISNKKTGFFLYNSTSNLLALDSSDKNSLFGYHDNSVGGGTLRTANIYSSDEANLNKKFGSFPYGIATPQT